MDGYIQPAQTTGSGYESFRKARFLLVLSFSGIIFPPLGIVLALVALRRLSGLTSADPAEQKPIDGARRLSAVSALVASILLLLEIGALVYLFGFGGWKELTKPPAVYTGPPPSINITGTVTLYDPPKFGNLQNDDPCNGSGQYADVIQGAQVVVRDDTNAIIAIANLKAGQADGQGDCLFRFAINGLPYTEDYNFQLTHRPVVAYTYERLNELGLNIPIKVGHP